MSLDAYKRIDVDVFKDIMESEFLAESKSTDKNSGLIDIVRKMYTIELRVPGIDTDIKKESAKIRYRQYGFRAKTDFKIDFRQDIFENETILFLVPQKVYELEDVIKKMPLPYSEKDKELSLLLEDSFERLKVKSKNILQNSCNDEQITHYAKKNIQVAIRNCYDARLLLVKIQETKDKYEIFPVYMANVFMINVLAYLTKMFSSYYTERKNEKDIQRLELCDIMDLNLFMEPKPEDYQNKEAEEVKPGTTMPKFKWNLHVNQFMTIIYDMINYRTEEDLPALEIDIKDLEEILTKRFVDKKGIPFKKSTINTCLKSSREDKRVSGLKKIDVLRHFDPKNG